MCSGGVMNLYSKAEGQFIKKSSLLFGRNLQETFCIFEVGSYLLLMIGGYDSKIHVYTTKRDMGGEITFRFSMLGHLNSIKDLSVSPAIGQNTRYLASGSQD
jgi:WD40 repeat protein